MTDLSTWFPVSLRAPPEFDCGIHTILTCLILIVTKSPVERSKLTELIALELVLAFRNRGSLDRYLVFQMAGVRDYLQFQ